MLRMAAIRGGPFRHAAASAAFAPSFATRTGCFASRGMASPPLSFPVFSSTTTRPRRRRRLVPLTRVEMTRRDFSYSRNSRGSKKQKKQKQKKKQQQASTMDIAQKFDVLAQREGFDRSMAFFAHKEDLVQDNDDDSLESFFDSSFYSLEDFTTAGAKSKDDNGDKTKTVGAEGLLAAEEEDDDDDDDLDLDEFDNNDDNVDDDDALAGLEHDDENDDDMVVYDLSDHDMSEFERGVDMSLAGAGDSSSMDARIRQASRERSGGAMDPAIFDEMEKHAATTSSKEALQKMGYPTDYKKTPKDDEEEEEGPVLELVTNALVCGACGSPFQSQNEQLPGFLPLEKYQHQVQLGQLEELERLQRSVTEGGGWTPEEEIEWLVQTSQGEDKEKDHVGEMDVAAKAAELGLDYDAVQQDRAEGKRVICKRCHGLQNFGTVEEALRPQPDGEGVNATASSRVLSQEHFLRLLRPIRNFNAIVICLVDLFDFTGSILPHLDEIVGETNPVLFAANKADLLPSQMGPVRVENWIRRELEYLGIQSIAPSRGGGVRLVSCKTGFGLAALLAKAQAMAEERSANIYVVGAANAGKSSFLNHLLENVGGGGVAKKRQTQARKRRAGNASSRKGAVTTSPLPGTTLEFIKVTLRNGIFLYDTPGLLVPGTLTQRLTPEELKMVVPKKTVEPITFRVASGKCVWMGGLARIEVVGDSKPFLFTFFVSNDIKLHATDSSKAQDVWHKLVGNLLTPPLRSADDLEEEARFWLDSGKEENEEQKWDVWDMEIAGTGWKEAAADISVSGLGWVAVTGAGVAQVRMVVPRGVAVTVRPPLMPLDVWQVASKYTGGRAVRKGGRSSVTGKWRKGVGRR